MFELIIPVDRIITLPLGRNAAYGTLDVDTTRLPANATEYVWLYGLKQVINDAMATKVDKDGKDLSAQEIADKADAKLQALYDGTLRMRGESTPSDPYEAQAYREAKIYVVAALNKRGAMKSIPKDTKNRFMYAVNRELAKVGKPEMDEGAYLAMVLDGKQGASIRERARRIVDERRDTELEMDDLI
jgi:hypothetical protein